jgi:catechol 2,3-dioxygenase-like lactoylglutathione lyase family enzyme
MPRAIDHVVIPTLDLAAQATLYRRLGFQVGARNRHPWGTENHIVQFDGAFLELIAWARDSRRRRRTLASSLSQGLWPSS